MGVAGLQANGIASDLRAQAERPVEVVLTYVRPRHRRRGYGLALLKVLEATAVELRYRTLLVVSGSHDRLHGYPYWRSRYGSPTRIDENYFGIGEERTVWRRQLGE